MKKIAYAAAAAIVLAAAPAQADGTKELLGTVLGGAVGGFAGSKIGKGSGRLAATAGGAVLGAMIGNGAGASMDRADRMYRGGGYYNGGYGPSYGSYGRPRVYYPPPPPTVVYTAPSTVYVERRVAVPVYRERRWRDYDYAPYAYGGYAPAAQPQEHCREYQSNVSVGGLPQPGYGIACLQPDGSWKIVK